MEYQQYLKLDNLLTLQEQLSEEPSELMFIVAHQSSEVWFKVLIHELNNDSIQTKRIVKIFEHLNTLWDVVATMSSEQYERFRETLGTASGQQSEQHIEVKKLLTQLQDKCNEEELYDIENAFKKWQFAHMKTVERIIGNKRGTGGTSGVTYLKRAVDEPLWDSVK